MFRFAAGDANLYRYVFNTPTAFTHPSGLEGELPWWVRFVSTWDYVLGDYRTGWFAQVSDFSAGWGDTLSFGITRGIRWFYYANEAVGFDSWAYTGGQVMGIIHTTALGWACGSAYGSARGLIRGMSRPNVAFPRGIEWVERSHWIPKRYLPRWMAWQGWNQKLVWGTEHALMDPRRYRFMPPWWKEANPLPPWWVRQWNRLPYWTQGALFGMAYGWASVQINRLVQNLSPVDATYDLA